MYFFDEISNKEVQAILNAQDDLYINNWEQTRFLAYIQAVSAGAKIKNPTDLIKFDWDADIAVEEVSPEELQQRKQQMLNFIQGSKSLKEFTPILSK